MLCFKQAPAVHPSALCMLQVMRRVGKLMYEWVGFDHLPGLLEQLAEDETNGGKRLLVVSLWRLHCPWGCSSVLKSKLLLHL